jgi:hypothetical protein
MYGAKNERKGSTTTLFHHSRVSWSLYTSHSLLPTFFPMPMPMPILTLPSPHTRSRPNPRSLASQIHTHQSCSCIFASTKTSTTPHHSHPSQSHPPNLSSHALALPDPEHMLFPQPTSVPQTPRTIPASGRCLTIGGSARLGGETRCWVQWEAALDARVLCGWMHVWRLWRCVGKKGESEGCTWGGRCAAVPRVDLNITGVDRGYRRQ